MQEDDQVGQEDDQVGQEGGDRRLWVMDVGVGKKVFFEETEVSTQGFRHCLIQHWLTELVNPLLKLDQGGLHRSSRPVW